MANIYDMSDTWNDGATTFTSIKMNVTDTASSASSLLMDLQVGGTSRFKVSKNGNTDIGDGVSDVVLRNGATGRFITIGTSSGGIGLLGNNPGNNRISLGSSANVSVGGTLRFTSGASFGWVPSSDAFAAFDLQLHRDAANTLAQRNGVNAQTFNLYNTYTDASNYERGVFDFTSVANTLTIGTTKAGTGATRIVRFVVGGTRVAISDGSYFQFDVDLYPTQNVIMAAKYTEMAEMTAPSAPAANKVRIYAEDDGAGKTRLMALFPTGAAQQIAIEP